MKRFALIGTTLVAAMVATGCLKGNAPTQNGFATGIDLRAQVISDPGASLHVTIGYERRVSGGGDTITDNGYGYDTTISLFDHRYALPAATDTFAITVDVNACLSDPNRAFGGPSCELMIGLALDSGTTQYDTTTITDVAVNAGQTVVVTPNVVLVQLDSLHMGPQDFEMAIGTTVQLVDTAFDVHGNSYTNLPMTWYSEDTTVATVSATGLLTGKSVGYTTIEAYTGYVYASTAVSVY